MRDGSDDRLDDLIAAWRADVEDGCAVDAEDVIRANPDVAHELRARFEAIRLLERRGNGRGMPRRGVPERIDDFRLLREIGRGGMGVVYEAEQVSMKRRVALKVLFPSVTSSPKAVKRFQQEAHAAGRLKHTNIVAVHRLGQEDGLWYSAMELVQGRALSDVIDQMKRDRHDAARRRKRGLSSGAGGGTSSLTGESSGTRAYYASVARMFADVAEALQVAHDHGVIHRDIKPGNLLLDAEGNLKIVDFGLARLDEGGLAMTATGDLVGTPLYMSPEQFAGGKSKMDHRSDVYALGATLYEVLALRPPFQGPNLVAITQKVLKQEPVPPRRWDGSVPRDLETVVLKALEKEPAKRYRTAADMARDLRLFALGDAIRARRLGLLERGWRKVTRYKVRSALAAGMLVAVAGVLVLADMQSASAERNRILEYQQIRRAAADALVRADSERYGQPVAEPVADMLRRAIALMPDHPEAYRDLALGERPGRPDSELDGGPTPEECLASLEAARERGLAESTYVRGCAFLLLRAGRHDEVDAFATRFDHLPRATAADAYLEAGVVGEEGALDEVVALLDEALDRAREDPFVRHLALEARAEARELTGDFDGAIQDRSALLAVYDGDIANRVEIASLWRGVGRHEDAQRMFEATIEAVRALASEDAWVALANDYRFTKQQDWVIAVNEAAHEAFPRSPRFLFGKAQALRSSHLLDRDGRRRSALDAALAAAEKAIELDSEYWQGHYVRGTVLVELERFEDALVALDRAGALNAEALVHVSTWRAAAYEGMGDLERARTEYEARRAAYPGDALAILKLAFLYTDLKLSAEAIEAADAVSALRPLWPDPHVVRGIALYQLYGHDGEAIEAYHEAKRLGRDDVYVRIGLSRAYWRKGLNEDALREANSALELDPRSSEALVRKARATAMLGRYPEALKIIDEALEAVPETASAMAHALSAKGQMQIQMWKLPEAEATLRRSIEIEDTSRARERLCENLTWQKRYEEAAVHGRRAVELQPKAHNTYFYLGLAYIYGEEWEKAEQVYRLALEQQKYSGTYGNLSHALNKLGRHEEALELLEEAVRLDSKNADFHEGRAELLVVLQRPEEALAALDEGLAGHWLDKRHIAQLRLARCDVLIGLRRFEEVLVETDRVVELLGDRTARTARARIAALLGLERYDESLPLLDFVVSSYQLAEPDPEDRQPLIDALERALAHLASTERFELLGACSDRALALDGANEKFREWKALALAHLDRDE